MCVALALQLGSTFKAVCRCAAFGTTITGFGQHFNSYGYTRTNILGQASRFDGVIVCTMSIQTRPTMTATLWWGHGFCDTGLSQDTKGYCL